MQRRTMYAILAIAAASAHATDAAKPPLDRQFERTVQPFITTYCAGCHSGKTAAAQFDLKAYTAVDMVTRDYPRWALMMKKLTAREMPPKAVPQPSAGARQQVINWIQAVRAE